MPYPKLSECPCRRFVMGRVGGGTAVVVLLDTHSGVSSVGVPRCGWDGDKGTGDLVVIWRLNADMRRTWQRYHSLWNADRVYLKL